MRSLVLRYGRARVWLALLTAFLVVVVAIPRAHSLVNPEAPGIAPEEALANGGHIVNVWATCDGYKEMISGSFEVITLAGGPPKYRTGDLSGNLAQMVVGPDWIGRVRIIQRDLWVFEIHEQTDLIGEAFGWHTRRVRFESCR